MTSFVDQLPNTGFCCGPLGVVNTPAGILGNNYPGDLRTFSDVDGHHWNDSPTSQSYGFMGAVGLATLGGAYYMTQQTGRVIQVNADGTFVQNIVNIGNATGIVGNPANGHLYVSNGGQVFEVDPVAKTFTVFFNNFAADGLTISPAGDILYLEAASHIFGFDTTSKTLVFDSGFISGGPDGTALGAGTLAGSIFVNTNGATLVQVDLTTLLQTLLVTGGSRGDFVTVDTSNGTLLFTQTDSVLRLTGPTGGCFGSTCAVPVPGELPLMAIGLVGLALARRRRELN